MAKIKNSGDIRCWWGCGERGTLLHCWWDCKLVQPLWKSVWQFLRKLDLVLPEDTVIPFLGIYPKDAPTCNRDTGSTMFIVALFIIGISWKQPKCFSTGEWIQKMWYIFIMEYYSAIKQRICDILRKIYCIIKYPEWGNPVTNEHKWHVLTDKWVLA